MIKTADLGAFFAVLCAAKNRAIRSNFCPFGTKIPLLSALWAGNYKKDLYAAIRRHGIVPCASLCVAISYREKAAITIVPGC
jgi:hypothetical protein